MNGSETKTLPNKTTGTTCVMNRAQVLSELHAYASSGAREEADQAYKSCMWQLTKARHVSTRGLVSVETAYLAKNIREELQASVLVRVEDRVEPPPDLVEDVDESSCEVSFSPLFSLVDFVEERELQKEAGKENQLSVKQSVKSAGSGLRLRKTSGLHSSKESTPWTMESSSSGNTYHDPIELFGGLPPKELKDAQKSARRALQFYVRAANDAAKVLAYLGTNRSKP